MNTFGRGTTIISLVALLASVQSDRNNGLDSFIPSKVISPNLLYETELRDGKIKVFKYNDGEVDIEFMLPNSHLRIHDEGSGVFGDKVGDYFVSTENDKYSVYYHINHVINLNEGLWTGDFLFSPSEFYDPLEKVIYGELFNYYDSLFQDIMQEIKQTISKHNTSLQ